MSAIPRRDVLRRLLLGTAGLGVTPALLRAALAADGTQGIRRMQGEVYVDGKRASVGQQIGLGQTVQTGADGQVIFVMGAEAFLQHANSEFLAEQIRGVQILRYLTGRILSVFGDGRKELDTPTSVIGIRGTACYIEASLMRTYFCLCYGAAQVIPKGDPNRRKVLRTAHHDYPLYIDYSAGARAIVPAPVINHKDSELVMLEALVGRRPPFLDQPAWLHGGY